MTDEIKEEEKKPDEPVEDTPKDAEKNPDKPKDFGKERDALLVEDDPSSAQLVKSILEKVGFTVIMAVNGTEALQKISESPPQIIIIDALMPEMDGFSLLKELKNKEETKKVPVVVISSRKNMEDTFLVSGVSSFFSKPLDTEKFLSTLADLPLKRKVDVLAEKEAEEKKEEEGEKKEDEEEKKE